MCPFVCPFYVYTDDCINTLQMYLCALKLMQMRRAPSSRAIAIEAKVMFTMNKTSEWLASLNPSKRNTVIEEAKRRTSELKARFREREKEINDLRAKRLEEKREKVRAKAAKTMSDRRALIAKVNAMGGLWETEEELKRGVEKAKSGGRGQGKTRVIAAIKSQMAYRRQILEQPVIDKTDWSYSEGSVACDVPTLAAKLTKIILQAPAESTDGECVE